METYGYPALQWGAAKEEAREAMIRIARAAGITTYGELVKEIHSIKFGPHDFKLFHLLGQISTSEHEAGRAMLSAVVVSKDDTLPGPGFFDLAKRLGHSFMDPVQFWSVELKKVHSVHSAEASHRPPNRGTTQD